MSEDKKITKTTKTRGVRRNTLARAASSPIPEGAVQNSCGHGGCSATDSCRVRYVGQTTHLRDHYAMHAARGVTHIWAAAIVTGLGVVLTGAVGYSAVQASDMREAADERRQMVSQSDIVRLSARLEDMERAIADAKAACSQAQTGARIEGDESSTVPLRREPAQRLEGATGSTSSEEGVKAQ